MVPRSMSNRSCDLRLSLLSARRPEPSSVDRLPLFCGLYAVCFCIYVPNFHPNFCFIPAATRLVIIVHTTDSFFNLVLQINC